MHRWGLPENLESDCDVSDDYLPQQITVHVPVFKHALKNLRHSLKLLFTLSSAAMQALVLSMAVYQTLQEV